jgi:two-component sensor histidine kinase
VCESSGFAVVELREYLHSISTALLSLYGVRPDRIALTLEVDIAEMDADKAVPCGLILAELCSNALHHAFPENSKGEVSISFRSRETEYRLEVKDNGVGLPEEIDFRHTTTLGLRLVNLLVSQMRGTIDLNNANGACFTLTFPR